MRLKCAEIPTEGRLTKQQLDAYVADRMLEELESRVEDHMISMLTTWEYQRKVSKKRVREAIQYLDKNKPGWHSTGDLIDVLESEGSGSARRSSQGCLVMLAVSIFIVWFVATLFAR